MENKKKIGIDINEIFRALWIKFDYMYREEFGEEGAPDDDKAYVYDFFNEYEWKDTEETVKLLNEDIPDDIDPIYYQVDEDGKSAVDVVAFDTEKNKLTAKEVYNRFMYEDYLFDIFAAAPKLYQEIDVHGELFYKKYKEQFDIELFSTKENWFTIPSTLSFLSKIRPRIKTYKFLENNEELKGLYDYVITTDPEIISDDKFGSKLIKLDRPYNVKSGSGDFSTLNLFDLIKNDDFEKFISYRKELKDLKGIEVEELENWDKNGLIDHLKEGKTAIELFNEINNISDKKEKNGE